VTTRCGNRLVHALLIAALLAMCFAGCARRPPQRSLAPPGGVTAPSSIEPQTAARFVDVAAESGIEFAYRNGERAGNFAILEIVGGGAGLVDFDADGQLDFVLPGGGEFPGDEATRGLPTVVYRHAGDWRYVEVAAAARMRTAPYFSHGVAAADVDQDGFIDIAITGYGGLLLWMNQGDGTFRDGTAEAGLDIADAWPTSAAWGDLNGDGWLDLFAANYVDWSFDNNPLCVNDDGRRDVCGPKRFGPRPDQLFVSDAAGRFAEVSRQLGLRTNGKGLGVVIGDVDLDGDSDIYVANDATANFLYRNDGQGRFEEIGLIAGCGYDETGAPDGSMGADLADYNGDGWPDLWVVNFEQETFALYQNLGGGGFLHASQASGMAAEAGLYIGWGTSFFDFDRDADLDVFVSNGAPFQFPTVSPRRQRPLLFENDGGSWFTNVARVAGAYTASPHDARGVAVGDLGNDGLLDLVVSHINETLAVLRNESATNRSWIGIDLVGRSGVRSAHGAIVEIQAGGRRQTGQVKGGTSYLATHDKRLFFGLDNVDTVDSLTIRWPGGDHQSLAALPGRRYWVIREGREPISLTAEEGSAPSFTPLAAPPFLPD